MDPTSFDDLAMVRRFLERGRSAIRLDARHLVFWGLTLCGGLALQYPAEVLDWAPSAALWIWQPLALLGWAALVLRHGSRPAALDPTLSVCRLAFGAAGLATAASYLGALAGRAPEGYPTVLVACASAALAFVVAAALTQRTVAWVAAAGWFALLVWFVWHGRVAPTDFLVLAFACAFFLALPGIILGRAPRARPSGGIFA